MRVRATASVVLMLVGIIFAAIYAWWVFSTFSIPPKVTWTTEATYFYGNYTAGVFAAINPNAAYDSTLWAHDFAVSIANETDFVVDIIDVRVGMARVWWELSQSSDPSNRIFPGSWTWNRWTPDQLGISFTPQAAYDRLREGEGKAETQFNFPTNWLQVGNWSFEAVMYYWNPGEPYYNIPDQPDMKDVLRREANYTGEFHVEEFRAMFANATVKAETIASQTDKVVDLQDLRDAIAIILQQQYPDRYGTFAVAWDRLVKLEAEVGLTLA